MVHNLVDPMSVLHKRTTERRSTMNTWWLASELELARLSIVEQMFQLTGQEPVQTF